MWTRICERPGISVVSFCLLVIVSSVLSRIDLGSWSVLRDSALAIVFIAACGVILMTFTLNDWKNTLGQGVAMEMFALPLTSLQRKMILVGWLSAAVSIWAGVILALAPEGVHVDLGKLIANTGALFWLLSVCAYLFFRINAKTKYCRRLSSGSCPWCRYSLVGLEDRICPECGHTMAEIP